MCAVWADQRSRRLLLHREVKRKKEMKHAQDRLAQEPALDFSLKEGQTITVNIKTVR